MLGLSVSGVLANRDIEMPLATCDRLHLLARTLTKDSQYKVAHHSQQISFDTQR